MVLPFESVDEILKCNYRIQLKAIEQYFHAGLSNMLYVVVLPFESVDEIFKCDHSNKGIEPYFPVVLFILLYKVDFGRSQSITMQMKAIQRYGTVCS